MKNKNEKKRAISVLLVVLLFLVSFIVVGSDMKNDYVTQDFPTDVNLEGLTDKFNITFAGNSSYAAVFNPYPTYCNSSGIRYETMKVNLTVNATHPIHFIIVYSMDFINASTNYRHNASNVTLWVSGDNITYSIWPEDKGWGNGRFPDAGGYLTLNGLNWINIPGSPWEYHGDLLNITENCSFYLRFQCNLTLGMEYGYYENISNWAVEIYNETDALDGQEFTEMLRNGLESEDECCIDANLTVWDNTTGAWVKHYNTSQVGEEVKFNLSFHNCGKDITNNTVVYTTNYDALSYYVPGSGRIKYPGQDIILHDPSITWEDATCEYPGHGHMTWQISGLNLTNWSYCNWIYLEFNMTVNNSNYSRIWAGVYECPFDYEWWDSMCYSITDSYVNEWFNTGILCDCDSPEYSNWTVSEHINRNCDSNGCYDEEWFGYETEFGRWAPYNDSDQWEWVYRYDNADANGTDELNLSYTIVNNSDINFSQLILRMRYNVTNYSEFTTQEPYIGIIYSYTNNTCFDMILFSYNWLSIIDNVFLLSKRGDNLVNTLDNTVVSGVSDCYEYYDYFWPTDTTLTPYFFDPSTNHDGWGGIWVKTIYNEFTGHLQSKLWRINTTYPFALQNEIAGWVVNETLDNIVYNESKCFGLVVWNPGGKLTEFTADFDFIEYWRLNYSKDIYANESVLENHSVYGNKGIPLVYFPTHNSYDHSVLWDSFINNCFIVYLMSGLTNQEFADCSACFYEDLGRLYSFEARAFDSTYTNAEGQKDNIYYYSTLETNLSFDYSYNNSLNIQIEECTDGTQNSYDGAVVAIDVDNNQQWDDNDMALYWYISGGDVWYVVYNGTTVKYYSKMTVWDPDMNINFIIDYSNLSYTWFLFDNVHYPPIHRYDSHRVYGIDIPLYYLEKGFVGSGNFLNANDTFGLHIMTTNDDYSASPVWENWNETTETYYTVNDNDADASWTTYMNCTSWDECVDFEQGLWNGVTHAQMQYWGLGRIGNESGLLIESSHSANITKISNVTTISNIAKDNIVNYTITVCNDGDLPITIVKVNDTFPSGVVYISSSMPVVNVSHPYGNSYVFILSDSMMPGSCITFNITVNITAGASANGTNITNRANATADNSVNATAEHNITYGINRAPIIISAYPFCNRTITEISLLLADINATVQDPDADAMDIYFYTNKTISVNSTGVAVSEWHAIGQTLASPNGTYQTNQTFTMTTDNNQTRWRWGNTNYWWNISVTDGKVWTNETYWFITVNEVNGKNARFDVWEPLGIVSGTDAQKIWNSVNSLLEYDGIYDVWSPYTLLSGTDAQRVWYIINS